MRSFVILIQVRNKTLCKHVWIFIKINRNSFNLTFFNSSYLFYLFHIFKNLSWLSQPKSTLRMHNNVSVVS